MSISHSDLNYLMGLVDLDYEAYADLTMVEKLAVIASQLKLKLKPTQPTLVDLCLGDAAAAEELAKAVGSFRQSGTPVQTNACAIDVVKGMIRQRDVAKEERAISDKDAEAADKALRRADRANINFDYWLKQARARIDQLETVVADHAIQQMLDAKLAQPEEADNAED